MLGNLVESSQSARQVRNVHFSIRISMFLMITVSSRLKLVKRQFGNVCISIRISIHFEHLSCAPGAPGSSQQPSRPKSLFVQRNFQSLSIPARRLRLSSPPTRRVPGLQKCVDFIGCTNIIAKVMIFPGKLKGS